MRCLLELDVLPQNSVEPLTSWQLLVRNVDQDADVSHLHTSTTKCALMSLSGNVTRLAKRVSLSIHCNTASVFLTLKYSTPSASLKQLVLQQYYYYYGSVTDRYVVIRFDILILL